MIDEEYPIFYKTKTSKGALRDCRYFYRSAIDNALKNNQLKAVGLIIKYICKYQNNMASAYLFQKNFQELFRLNVDGLTDLLNSNIFRYEFDFEEWPSSHSNNANMIIPYNESLFNIRYQSTYEKLFPGSQFKSLDPIFNTDLKGLVGKIPGQ